MKDKYSNQFLKKWSRSRNKLRMVLDRSVATEIVPASQAQRLAEATLVITYNEVCHYHGTGILMDRLFGLEKNVIHLYSTATYPYNNLGDITWKAGHAGRSDMDVFTALSALMAGHTIRRILCVPFAECDLRSALAARELCGAPLCFYLMDDQNIHSSKISDSLMRRALESADLILAISPEMRDAYEQKYGSKIWILPPTVRIPFASTPPATLPDAMRGVLVGNIWNKGLLEKLLASLRDSGLQIDWFSNGAVEFTDYTVEQLRDCGLHLQGHLEEGLLTARLRDYAYSLVLAGSPEEDGEHAWLTALSLPSRLPFVVAAGGLPVLALGERGTPVSHFVEHFEVGLVSAPSRTAFREAAERLCSPESQTLFRRNIRKIAPLFDCNGMASWVWASLEKGRAMDDRFETAFGRTDKNMTPWIDAPVPEEVFWQFRLLFQSMARLKLLPFYPDFVLDVGCSTGVWSHTIRPLFPASRFLLVDPLLQRYRLNNPWYHENNPDFEWFETALGQEEGTVTFNVSGDLYGSSLLDLRDGRSYESNTVPMTTIDLLLPKAGVEGRGLLKIDVQNAEHCVLAGAARSLDRFDCVILELSLSRMASGAKTFMEMLELMREYGFVYHDDAGDWRSPKNGSLIQKDVVFVRPGLTGSANPASL